MTYNYLCTNCKLEIEVVQKITDNAVKTCPECKHETLVRQLSPVNTHFKGNGWPDKQ